MSEKQLLVEPIDRMLSIGVFDRGLSVWICRWLSLVERPVDFRRVLLPENRMSPKSRSNCTYFPFNIGSCRKIASSFFNPSSNLCRIFFNDYLLRCFGFGRLWLALLLRTRSNRFRRLLTCNRIRGNRIRHRRNRRSGKKSLSGNRRIDILEAVRKTQINRT